MTQPTTQVQPHYLTRPALAQAVAQATGIKEESTIQYLSRNPPETITMNLSGIWTNPETGESKTIVIYNAEVIVTPQRYL